MAKIGPSRLRDLLALAEEVANCHSPASCMTDMRKIIRENSIGLHFDDYGDAFDGALELAGGAFHIHINRTRCGHVDSDRTRFTLGHELGHFFIDEHRQALQSGAAPHGSTCGMFDNADTPEEMEADLFAANLLMPPSRFLPSVPRGKSPLEAILSLAAKFKSSLTATAIHYASIAADRCAIIRWNADGTFAWKKVGGAYYAEGFRKPRYAAGHLPAPDSATGLVIAGKVAQAETASTMGTVFLNVAAGGNRDHILREEALVLGGYGFMTIISDHPLTPTKPKRAICSP